MEQENGSLKKDIEDLELNVTKVNIDIQYKILREKLIV